MKVFHFIDGNTKQPLCGAPLSTHATTAVESVPQCPACLALTRQKS